MNSLLSVKDAVVGDTLIGRTRVRAIRSPSAEGAPYQIVELSDDLGSTVWGWLHGDLRHVAPELTAGDEIWVRAVVTEAWPSGAYDLHLVELHRIAEQSDPHPHDELADDEELIYLGCSNAIATHLLRLLKADLEHTTSKDALIEQIRALTMFLEDAISETRSPGAATRIAA